MLARHVALTDRLQKLIDRIQSRIDKIEATNPGIDLTSPKKDLADAKIKLTSAKAKIDALKGDIQTLLTCEDFMGQFKALKEKASEIKSDLKEVHRLLVHSIGTIKGLRVGDDKASPKPESTPDD